MPEGDTIHRIAIHLRRVLEHESLVEACSPRIDAQSLVGRRVEAVQARGKNLYLAFDDGRVLHTHLRMRGSWFLYPNDDSRARMSPRCVLLLRTAAWTALCFEAPEVSLMQPHAARAQIARRNAGLDVLADDFDIEAASTRLKALSSKTMAEALLDQRALAGLGNVYKSELLFMHRLDPFARVEAVDDEALRALIEDARRLLRLNLRTRGRTTTGADRNGARLHVYERSGLPCRACGARIEMRRVGEAARSTYFCPACQRVPT